MKCPLGHIVRNQEQLKCLHCPECNTWFGDTGHAFSLDELMLELFCQTYNEIRPPISTCGHLYGTSAKYEGHEYKQVLMLGGVSPDNIGLQIKVDAGGYVIPANTIPKSVLIEWIKANYVPIGIGNQEGWTGTTTFVRGDFLIKFIENYGVEEK